MRPNSSRLFRMVESVRSDLNGTRLQCSIAYTDVTHISLAEVRTALPTASYATELVASLSDGGKCSIRSERDEAAMQYRLHGCNSHFSRGSANGPADGKLCDRTRRVSFGWWKVFDPI